MQMFHTRDDGTVIEFTYTFPKDEWHHATHKLKVSDIKILSPVTDKPLIKREILQAIQEWEASEPKNSRKGSTTFIG